MDFAHSFPAFDARTAFYILVAFSVIFCLGSSAILFSDYLVLAVPE